MSQLQQKLLAANRDRGYRWYAATLREHYTLRLNVARRALEITQTTSNGLSLGSQVKTLTMNVDIEEYPEIDGMLLPA